MSSYDQLKHNDSHGGTVPMKNKTTGIVLAFAIIAIVILYAVTDGMSATGTVDAGSIDLRLHSRLEVVQPLTATTSITDGRYDSFDAPAGMDYSVDATQIVTIGQILANSAAADIRIDYGYADDHVEDSIAAPTNPVTIGSFIVPTSAGLLPVNVYMRVPADKHPFVRVVGAASNGHVTMLGFTEVEQ